MIALVALIAFVFFTVFATVGLVVTVSHTCVGIHCRTCERISVVQNTVNILKTALFVLALLLFVSETIKVLSTRMPPLFHSITSVTLKTKLSN